MPNKFMLISPRINPVTGTKVFHIREGEVTKKIIQYGPKSPATKKFGIVGAVRTIDNRGYTHNAVMRVKDKFTGGIHCLTGDKDLPAQLKRVINIPTRQDISNFISKLQ